ncbi:UDP-glucose 4-epimerase GalE [Vibrio aestuarianus]|uniref:UDP-glucose 4-epimerase GalE n=1 Tax=Vibrio aestuarianus TaxID=28171 RepID=UPI00237C920D|nr:UDP-glucose 4-epimerase GalE [Vibrio aestuarianus]MDE1313605.1 UDP-glucose 4-epimerase GalE [Vibrio aestuarianus]
MKVLVTGGMGYIGNHTCVQMLNAGIEPIIIDNLCNAKDEVLNRIKDLTGQKPIFYRGDIRDEAFLDSVFNHHDIQSVIHFAGVKSIVFSSSATVYGDPEVVPITETSPTGATTNPYGRSKYMVEECLSDLFNAENDWSITLLRYFNPVGAHPSGTMGEDPQGIPNNLMPFIAQVAVGRREKLSIFGNDYPTIDGTGVRDYIHVMDLADGHVAALKAVGEKAGLHIYNLGTGKGSSVLEMVDAFAQASGKPVPYELCPRRAGDIAECWASTEKAERELGWKATRSVMEMTADTWNWQSNNPNGYSPS